MARLLMVLGALIAVTGVAIELGVKWPRLPGDFVIRRGNMTMYFPVATCLVVSVVLSIVAAVLRR
jgi:hypothetical protein